MAGDLVGLERAFHGDMVGIYRKAKSEAGYPATYFLRMVSDQGGVRAARELLAKSKPSEGFTALWERGRLDLTVETLLLRPEYEPLFTEDERATARDRLEEYRLGPARSHLRTSVMGADLRRRGCCSRPSH
ncbi:hypothetical protein BCD48_03425 [Pseudofrankia sp. BMG5.36]|nr:hypothetical protein BCD48_03425 [Pseudofrankia sp. BMG5.36]